MSLPNGSATTISFSQAKDNLSALTKQANATGMPFVITKNKKPWVEVRPLSSNVDKSNNARVIPLKRTVSIPDLDELFKDFDAESAIIVEDGFASPTGNESI